MKMGSTRRKQPTPASKANLNSKKTTSAPQTRQQTNKSAVTNKPMKQQKLLIGQRKISFASAKISEKSPKNCSKNADKVCKTSPTKNMSKTKSIEQNNVINPGIVSTVSHSHSSPSVEELCVKMTLNEFHNKTNIYDLVREAFLRENKHLLDSYVERVYNQYIKKPEYRQDDLFKNLQILPAPINIDDLEGINANAAHDIERNDKTNYGKRKRNSTSKQKGISSDESNVQEDSSFKADDNEIETSSKKRKVITKVKSKKEKLKNKLPLESEHHNSGIPHDEEVFTGTNHVSYKLQRCPSPQEGCSKWLYKSNLPKNSSEMVDYSLKQNPTHNCKKYVDDLSLKEVREVCLRMSFKEFLEETNIVDVVKKTFEKTPERISKSVTVDSYINRAYNRYVKKQHKRGDNLFINLKVTERAIELYKTNLSRSLSVARHSNTKIEDTNKNKTEYKEFPNVPELSNVEPDYENSAVCKTTFSRTTDQKNSQFNRSPDNHTIDHSKDILADASEILNVNTINNQDLSTANSTKNLISLNSQGILMTKKPCPLSMKVKYMQQNPKMDLPSVAGINQQNDFEKFTLNQSCSSYVDVVNLTQRPDFLTQSSSYQDPPNYGTKTNTEQNNPIASKVDTIDRNSPTSISVEEMCVKMTLDEFHYNTNITELIREYLLKQKHPKPLLTKMLSELDLQVESVYNRYIRQPEYRRFDLFKNLMILAEPINIRDTEDINSKEDAVDLHRNDETNHGKRKRNLVFIQKSSNLDESCVQDDSSFETDEYESEGLNKKQKVIKQVNDGSELLRNLKPNREDKCTATVEEDQNLQRCPAPQEGCSKLLDKSISPKDNLQMVDPQSIQKSKSYVDNLSFKQVKAVCMTMSFQEFLEETNVVDVVEKYFVRNSKSVSKSQTVDSFVSRVYDRYVKKQDKRGDNLFNNIMVTDKAVELYKKNTGGSINLKAQQRNNFADQNNKHIEDVNKNKSQYPKTKYVSELSRVDEVSENSIGSQTSLLKITHQKESQSNHLTDNHAIDGNNDIVKDTSERIVANSTNNENTPTRKLIALNSQGILMTKKPCPLSMKMKYILGVQKVNPSSHTVNNDQDHFAENQKDAKRNQHYHLDESVPNESRTACVDIIGETEKITSLQQLNSSLELLSSGTGNDRTCLLSKESLPIKDDLQSENINQHPDTSKPFVNIRIDDVTTPFGSFDFAASCNHKNVNIPPQSNICRLSNVIVTAPEKQIQNENTAPPVAFIPTAQENEPFNNQSIINNTSLTNTTSTTTNSHSNNTTIIEIENHPIGHIVEIGENSESSPEKAKSFSINEDDPKNIVMKVELNDISAYSDDVECIPNKDETIISIYDDLTDTEKMLNELFNPTDKPYATLTTQLHHENSFEIANPFLVCNDNPNLQITNAITSENNKADGCEITSSGSSSEIPPTPESQINSSITNKILDKEKECPATEAVKESSEIGCVQRPCPTDCMRLSYPKHAKNTKNRSKFTPLVFIPNYPFSSKAKPALARINNASTSNENDALEDLIEEDSSQESLHQLRTNPIDASLQTNSQLLNADLTYLTSATIPCQLIDNINCAPINCRKSLEREIPISIQPILTALPITNLRLVPTLKNTVKHNNYYCLSYLNLRSVVFGESVNRLNYESSCPFLEKSKDRQIRATIKVSLGRCQRLQIIGDTLQILLGLNSKEWRCVMKLFEVIDRFEYQSMDPEPINKSLPYKILYYLFKTLPRFSQATLQSVTTGLADEVSCVRMSVEYFQPVRSLTQAFQPLILEKLKKT